jgi:hypothetical protein
MRRRRSFWTTLILTIAGAFAGGQSAQLPNDSHTANYRSVVQKLAYLKINASKPHPDPKPVALTEPEVNAYFSEGGVHLPKGVSQVHLASKPGVIDGHAHVDFEEIMQGHNRNNPMYSLFSGSHDIHVVAEATGANGVATIKTQTVELDGAAIPEWALDFFIQHYVTPRYPNVGMTSTFKMPLRIQTAKVESGKVVLEQR